MQKQNRKRAFIQTNDGNYAHALKIGDTDSTLSQNNQSQYGSCDEQIDQMDELRQYVDISDPNIEAQIVNLYKRHRVILALLSIFEILAEIALTTFICIKNYNDVSILPEHSKHWG